MSKLVKKMVNDMVKSARAMYKAIEAGTATSEQRKQYEELIEQIALYL